MAILIAPRRGTHYSHTRLDLTTDSQGAIIETTLQKEE